MPGSIYGIFFDCIDLSFYVLNSYYNLKPGLGELPLLLDNCKRDTSILPLTVLLPELPQSYLNDVHLVPSVVFRDNELLTKVPMDLDT